MKYTLPFLFVCFLAMACDAPKRAQNHAKSPQHSGKTTTSKPSPPKPPLAVSSESTNVAWLDSERLMPVLEMAQQGKKPVFVEFYASWCAPCKVMEEDIFTQAEVSRYLNTHFLNFHTNFDAESGKTIAAIYEVTQLPTVLFLNPQGVVLERHTGIANPSVLTALGNSALQKMSH
jgi:thiol:disulfide interchange protein